ncbi:hypothetical protein [Brucella anthropi]|uniref:hypothetical protein n=1 Tax=Brucella anthropi TaxID=529 RepID=UPI0011B0666E|nr:hypothetical protein [Ochrobactrum sp. MYb49]
MIVIMSATWAPAQAQQALSANQWAGQFRMKVISVLQTPELPLSKSMVIKVDLDVYPNGRLGNISVTAKPRWPDKENWIKQRIGRIRNVRGLRTDRPVHVSFPIFIRAAKDASASKR